MSGIEKVIENLFGPGSDFEKKMEAFGKEIEAKFGSGSDFEKKMEAFGKEIEAKFGSGSDFEKRMEAFGKEMEAKFGSGSDFEKKMEAFGKEMEQEFGPGSEFAETLKKKPAPELPPRDKQNRRRSRLRHPGKLRRQCWSDRRGQDAPARATDPGVSKPRSKSLWTKSRPSSPTIVTTRTERTPHRNADKTVDGAGGSTFPGGTSAPSFLVFGSAEYRAH